jgi:protein tyrosine/serine phosphatase
MVSIDRATPAVLRHVIYGLHHATDIARGVVTAPWSRSSWGLILNLPRFGVVVPGRVYRSGSPRSTPHFRHILELRLKTLLCVRYGGPSRTLRAFAADHGLELLHFDLDRAGSYDLDAASRAVRAALDPSAQPALVCCDGGRHHAGMVVALLRLETGYSLEEALAEYFSFAAPSPFADNVLFIVRAAQQLYARALSLAT